LSGQRTKRTATRRTGCQAASRVPHFATLGAGHLVGLRFADGLPPIPAEIDDERPALKAIRSDFHRLANNDAVCQRMDSL